MSQQRFLFLVSGKQVPSTRFRMLPFAKALRERGIRCDIKYSYPSKYDTYWWLGFRWSQRLKWCVRLLQFYRAATTRYDAIVIEREIFDNPTFDIEERYSKLDTRLILDIDDAVFLRYPKKFECLFSMVDHVIAGNNELVNVVQPFNKEVTVIPTIVDLNEYPYRENDGIAKEKIIIGWIGTVSNLPYLNQIVRPLERISQRHNIVLKIVTSDEEALSSLQLNGIPHQFVKWSGTTAVQQVSTFTIGVMPLQGNDWDKYKCGCKLIQYMACSVPTVASPVGINSEIVIDNENGLLADSETAWYEALNRLCESRSLRAKLAIAGRRTVEDKYQLQTYLDRFVEVLVS